VEIPTPFVAVCEGYGDARFIDAILEFKGITKCSVGCPSAKGGSGTGRTAIPKYLKGLKTLVQKNHTILRGILVVVDADTDANGSFNFALEALQSAEFPAPSKAFSVEGDPLRVAVFLIPGEGRTGTLEHILWDAAIKRDVALEKCVEDFSACTGGHIIAASDNQQAKMRVSAIVAAHCEDNPWASPGLLWSDKGNPIPISSECFKHISDFLVAFTT
jgi:hypothetical protein